MDYDKNIISIGILILYERINRARQLDIDDKFICDAILIIVVSISSDKTHSY